MWESENQHTRGPTLLDITQLNELHREQRQAITKVASK